MYDANQNSPLEVIVWCLGPATLVIPGTLQMTQTYWLGMCLMQMYRTDWEALILGISQEVSSENNFQAQRSEKIKTLKFHKEVSQQSGRWQAWRKKSRAGHQCEILFHYYKGFPFLFILLSYNISQPQFPLLPLLPVIPTPLSPRSTATHTSQQKRAGLSGAATKHRITRCNKTRYEPSCQGCVRRKRVSRADKGARDTFTPTVMDPTNSQAKQPQPTCLAQTHAGSVTAISFYQWFILACNFHSKTTHRN